MSLCRKFALVAAVLLLPFGAGAAPTIALHKTEIVGDSSDRTDALHALVAAEFARRGIPLSNDRAVQLFLSRRNDKSCMALSESDRSACMAELARAVGADRAIVVSIAPFVPRKLLLSAVVVGSDGTVLQSLNTFEYPRAQGSRLESVLESALSDFVGRLDLSVHAPAPKVEPAVATPTPPPSLAPKQSPSVPTTPSPAQPTTSSGRQNLAVTGLIAGTLFAGLGTWGMLDSASRYASIDDAYAAGALPPQSQKERMITLRSQAQRSRTLGLTGLGLGAAAIGTSVFLMVTSPTLPATASTGPTLLVGPTAIALSIPLR